MGDIDPLVDRFYRDYYERVFQSGGMAGFGYWVSHKLLEGKTARGTPRVLEIGAGLGQHFKFVKSSFSEYVMLDPYQEPTPDIGAQVEYVRAHAEDIGIDLGTFDRVLVSCVLHHVSDMPRVVSNLRRWIGLTGELRIFLPCDPGFLNRLFRLAFVVPRARRIGFLDYELVNAREHRNHYWAIAAELKHAFRGYRLKRKFFPLFLPVPSMNLFSIWVISGKELV